MAVLSPLPKPRQAGHGGRRAGRRVSVMHRFACVVALSMPAGFAAEETVTRFRDHIVRHEPVYFLIDPGIGAEPVTAKFQVSVAFALVADPRQSREPGHGRIDGLYVAYSQTSFWDLESESKPFLDSSYRPEGFWHHRLPAGTLGSVSAALEPGFQHESNGKAGDDSRSYNTVFLRAPWTWILGDGPVLGAEAKVLAYVGDLSENPEIERYRGHGELVVRLGEDDGWMAMARGRLGEDWDRGSVELSVSHPLDVWSDGWAGGYLYMQTFLGWSESLAGYDQKTEQPRLLVGWAMTR
jgi:outer membrane phospholipase A